LSVGSIGDKETNPIGEIDSGLESSEELTQPPELSSLLRGDSNDSLETSLTASPFNKAEQILADFAPVIQIRTVFNRAASNDQYDIDPAVMDDMAEISGGCLGLALLLYKEISQVPTAASERSCLIHQWLSYKQRRFCCYQQ